MDKPIARLSAYTTYAWTCKGCNYENESGFLGNIPSEISCSACRLEHRIDRAPRISSKPEPKERYSGWIFG